MDFALPTRQLGKTRVKLPVLGFGTAPAGNRLSVKDGSRLYEFALNQGITYFDTAPAFTGYGKAQEQLGHVLKGRRSEVFLVTKCREPRGDRALRLLQQSLRELQTDYADLVFVHNLGHDQMDPQMVFSPRGSYQALLKAKAQGLTRFIGLSGHNRPHRFVKALQHYDVDVLLNAVNFVDHHTYNFEQRVWPIAAKRNIGLIAMKVYAGAGKEQRGKVSYSVLSQSYLDMGFRYTFSQPHLSCAVIGMVSPQEVKENIERVRRFTPLDRRELYDLEQVGKRLSKQWGPHLGAII